MREKPTVLMVDDDQEILNLGRFWFEMKAGNPFVAAASYDEATTALESISGPIVVITDMKLGNNSNESGFQVLEWVRDKFSFRAISIVVTGVSVTEAFISLARRAGALLVLEKPVKDWDAIIQYASPEFVSRVLSEPDGLTKFERFQSFRPSVIRDLELATTHYHPVEAEGRQDKEHYPKVFSLVMADVDRLKLVNDLIGHAAGDCVLSGLASCIRGCIRSEDRVARKGGDEFLIWLPGHTEAEAQVIVDKLTSTMRNYIVQYPTGEPILYADGSRVILSATCGASQVWVKDISPNQEEGAFEALFAQANIKERLGKKRKS